MILVAGYEGIGDTFYQRPFIRELMKRDTVALATPWVEAYWDMPGLQFWYRSSMLPFQFEAAQKVPKTVWAPLHKRAPADYWLGYGVRDFKENKTILEGFENAINTKIPNLDMSFPLKDEWVEKALALLDVPTCIIRRPTIRREYNNPARNPDPVAFQFAVNEAKKLGLRIMSVGYIDDEREWIADKSLTGIDVAYEHGELSIYEIAALIKHADLTITGVGYATPLSCAVNGRCLTIFGGEIPPQQIYDIRMNMENQRFVAPVPFCRCYENEHKCYKHIDFDRISAEIISLGRRDGTRLLTV